MSAVAERTHRGTPVAKEKKPKAETQATPEVAETGKKLFGVRLDGDVVGRVEDTAKGLGLDETNFLRMVILENLPKYERRVRDIRSGNSPE